jgi:hypothetical protein
MLQSGLRSAEVADCATSHSSEGRQETSCTKSDAEKVAPKACKKNWSCSAKVKKTLAKCTERFQETRKQRLKEVKEHWKKEAKRDVDQGFLMQWSGWLMWAVTFLQTRVIGRPR